MATATHLPRTLVEDQVLKLGNVGWNQYVVINDTFEDRCGLRMTFLDGSLTLLSPSRPHDYCAELFNWIFAAVASGCGIAWNIAGSATFRVEALGVGVEPDKTYYFGEHATRLVGSASIDLTTQPQPDLALEVEYTNPADDAIVIFDRLGVPEVWRYHVKRDRLTFLHRRPEGGYEIAPTSKHLPTLTPDDVIGQIRLGERTSPVSAWQAQLANWVRDTIIPRLGRSR